MLIKGLNCDTTDGRYSVFILKNYSRYRRTLGILFTGWKSGCIHNNAWRCRLLEVLWVFDVWRACERECCYGARTFLGWKSWVLHFPHQENYTSLVELTSLEFSWNLTWITLALEGTATISFQTLSEFKWGFKSFRSLSHKCSVLKLQAWDGLGMLDITVPFRSIRLSRVTVDFFYCGFNSFSIFQIFWHLLKSPKSQVGVELIEMVQYF